MPKPQLKPKVMDSNLWFKPVEEWPLPESTTHDSLKKGIQMKAKQRVVARKLLNFQSYPMTDASFVLRPEAAEATDLRSSYMRDYMEPFPPICPPRKPIEMSPDHLFNRRPMHDLQMDPLSRNKFMDDHLLSPSQARKKVDFFRQLRNKSRIFEGFTDRNPLETK